MAMNIFRNNNSRFAVDLFLPWLPWTKCFTWTMVEMLNC